MYIQNVKYITCNIFLTCWRCLLHTIYYQKMILPCRTTEPTPPLPVTTPRWLRPLPLLAPPTSRERLLRLLLPVACHLS